MQTDHITSPHTVTCEHRDKLCVSGSVTLSNLVLSATSRSEADMLPMSSSDEDWERRLLEPCTVSLFRLEVEPVSFPELP